MTNTFQRRAAALWALLACLIALAALPRPAAAQTGRLVSAEWLQQNLGRADLVLLDASPAPLHAAGHIAGAIHADVFAGGMREANAAALERRLQSWGLNPGQKIVVYDQGAFYAATRLFFDLYFAGVPEQDLFILDGGLARWQAVGGAVTKAATPAPAKGTMRVSALRDHALVKLPEFLAASGDPARHALVDALEPTYFYGESKFFDRAGHVPHATLWPSEDFFNADKTFKSPDEIRRMARHLGIRPEQQVHTYCGGGGAAAVPFFALRFLAGYPQVRLYVGSLFEYLQDARGLPLWTYGAPMLERDMHWTHGWGGGMLRAFGIAPISVIDVRPPAAYALGHVPYAINIPAETFRSQLGRPAQLAELLGPAGVNPAHEAVIVSEGGLNPRSALAFLALEQAGQKRVSLLADSVDEWGLGGLPLSKKPTVVGRPQAPGDEAVPPATFNATPRAGMLLRDASAGPGVFPRVFVAAGKALPAKAPEAAAGGRLVHLPWSELVGKEGRPKAAKDLWSLINKAGVPRYAEIVLVADDPGEAAVNYFVFRLMGFADVKVLAAL